MVLSYGQQLAAQQEAYLRQQCRATAYLRTGLQQEYLLPPTSSGRTGMGLQRQPHTVGQAPCVSGHVATAACKPRRVQPDIAQGAARLLEEYATAAYRQDEAPLRQPHRDVSATCLFYRHKQP